MKLTISRKKQKQEPVIKIPSGIPRLMTIEGKIQSLAEAVRRDHEGNIRMCVDLIAIQDRLNKSAELIMDQAAKHAAELDFAAKQIGQMIECLQGQESELDQVVSQAALTDETKGNGVSDMAVIGFLPPGARP